ncbi:MAG: dTMP kinase [Alphaproteobacteria bacterium]|nr:MAG: dTMP kinase [Alphaproteobacteria bacterium]
MNQAHAKIGRFITLEGGEGVGKSTQARKLAASLEALGLTVIITREPGGVPEAEEIREILLSGKEDKWDPISEALLLNAARRQHVEKLIKPALAKGTWVISDRFMDSTMAYQGYVKSLGRETVQSIQNATLGDFKPDLTLIIDLPSDTTLKRVDKRKGKKDRIEAAYNKIHRILRGAFLDIAGAESDRCIVIDGTGGLDDVSTRILNAVVTRFHLHELQRKAG